MFHWIHPKLNLYVSFIKYGWASDLLLTNKKLTKVNREFKSPIEGSGFLQGRGENNE